MDFPAGTADSGSKFENAHKDAARRPTLMFKLSLALEADALCERVRRKPSAAKVLKSQFEEFITC